jgi:hypothetical protein
MATTLTGKRRAFIDAYLGEASGNATEAARIAGYATPKQEGSRLLREPAVESAIAAALKDRAMDRDEVLLRLSRAAKGNYLEIMLCMVVDPETGRRVLDRDEVERRGVGHLIAKVTPTKFGDAVEMIDTLGALVKLGQFHKLFTDRVEVQLSPEMIDSLSESELAEVVAGKTPARFAVAAAYGVSRN